MLSRYQTKRSHTSCQVIFCRLDQCNVKWDAAQEAKKVVADPYVDCNLLGRVREEGDNVEKVDKVDQEDNVEKVDQEEQGDKDGDPDWRGLIPTIWGPFCSWDFNWCNSPTPSDLGNSPVDCDGAHTATSSGSHRLLGTKLEYRDGVDIAPILAASGPLQLLVSHQVEHRNESRVAVAAAPGRPLRLGHRLWGLRVQVEFRQKTCKLHEWRWLHPWLYLIFHHFLTKEVQIKRSDTKIYNFMIFSCLFKSRDNYYRTSVALNFIVILMALMIDDDKIGNDNHTHYIIWYYIIKWQSQQA